ncbi:MFS transporter [Chloroflexota bacterium]
MSLASTKGPKFFYGYVVTIAAFFIFLVGWGIYTPTFSLFFKPVMTEFGWTRSETVLGYSLAMTVQGALSILMGWLTDRLGPRTVVSVFGSFLGICYLLLSQVSALWQFQIYYALVAAVGVSTLTVPLMATLARWFAKRRGLMTGIAQAGLGMGGLVFAPLTGWLIINHGWRTAYSTLGIITLAGIIIPALFLRRDPRELGQLPDGAGGRKTQQANNRNLDQQAAGLSLKKAILRRQFWMIVGIYFSFGFCRTMFMVHTAAHVQDLGFSLIHGANVLAAITGISIVGRIGMGRLADKTGSKTALLIGYAVMTVALIWGLVTRDLWGLYLFAIVFGLGWGAQAILRFAVTSETFGLASLGLLMGIFMLIESSGATLGSYLGGYIFDLVGNYSPAFWIAIGLSIVGIIIAWRLKPLVVNT